MPLCPRRALEPFHDALLIQPRAQHTAQLPPLSPPPSSPLKSRGKAAFPPENHLKPPGNTPPSACPACTSFLPFPQPPAPIFHLPAPLTGSVDLHPLLRVSSPPHTHASGPALSPDTWQDEGTSVRRQWFLSGLFEVMGIPPHTSCPRANSSQILETHLSPHLSMEHRPGHPDSRSHGVTQWPCCQAQLCCTPC